MISSLFFALLHFSLGSVLYGFFFGLLFAVVRIATDNLVYTMIMHLLFNTINVLLSYMKLTEIPVAVVFAVFVVAIILFITLVVLFFRKSVIEMHGSRFEGKYKPWKVITKEGYVTMGICIFITGMLLFNS